MRTKNSINRNALFSMLLCIFATGIAEAQWTTMYQTDFSSNPNWMTSVPGKMFWDPANGRYHVEVGPGEGQYSLVNFATIPAKWSFKLEFDVTMQVLNYASGISFGLAANGEQSFSSNAPSVWVNFGSGDGGHGTTVGYRTDSVVLDFFPAPYDVLTTVETTYRNVIIYDSRLQMLRWNLTNLTAGGVAVGTYTSTIPTGSFIGLNRFLVENRSTSTASGYLDKVIVDVSSDLVAYYSFNGNASDQSGFANHAEVFGSGFGPGQFGQALSLSSGSYALTPSSPSLEVAGKEITISAWVYPTNFWSGGKSIIVRKTTHPVSGGGYIFGIRDGTGSLQFGGLFEPGIEWQDTNPNTGSVPLNQWTHVAVTWDGQMVRYYQNGALVGTTLFAGTLKSSNQSLGIGRMPDNPFEYFYGNMDELRIYNRALAGSEISAQALTPNLDVQVYAGLTISGVVGRSYAIEYRNSVGGTSVWQPLTNITLATSPFVFFDMDSPSQPKRFYRASLIP